MMYDIDTTSMQGDSSIYSNRDTTASGKTNSSKQPETVLISPQPIYNRIPEPPTKIRTFVAMENHCSEKESALATPRTTNHTRPMQHRNGVGRSHTQQNTTRIWIDPHQSSAMPVTPADNGKSMPLTNLLH
jgi:hypothetical protein